MISAPTNPVSVNRVGTGVLGGIRYAATAATRPRTKRPSTGRSFPALPSSFSNPLRIKNKKTAKLPWEFCCFGVLGGIRTHGLSLRSSTYRRCSSPLKSLEIVDISRFSSVLVLIFSLAKSSNIR